ncbi:hypothetical protein FZI85_12620 [Mycobacterium sp. CBMA293]|uniref:hypothetical protein n=1 Tax=unclassified Mycolicibacterium TaxID=2636767 RepID=UPI0012DDB8CF|nr:MULTISPECIES: hypothetical protein [unclassified Mycolicibacterium]MUL47393.1 hypothetical protein [Mycolicibacterium sp. CBMA 360]MUL59378.1 hypothetical protein [Mycolicibacterium sp. CBMA 335]MUL71103.1 hypothetical protein [Mycolicibacterium sp. CBMA 311]MUL94746.1 hypothetical protein [Mycolicibacterium sp. CBMA 230]MUM09073.1 hypothetical protein [Mycolicibacterium sp. CBMA 213]
MTTLTNQASENIGPLRQLFRRSTAVVVLTTAGLGVAAYLAVGMLQDKPAEPVLPTFSAVPVPSAPDLTKLQNLGQLAAIMQAPPSR